MNYPQFRKQHNHFNSTDGQLAYIDEGQGNVIVLLHGIPTSSWLYRKMIPILSKNHRVIAPDMLGFGASDSPNGYEIYEPKEHAKRLLKLLDYLQIKEWTHVFHDAGGLWTWELLTIAPERVTNLVILNTIIFEEGFHPPIRFKPGLIAKLTMSMYSNGISTNAMLKGLFNSGLMKNNLSKEDLLGYKKPLLEGKVKAMYHFFSKTCNDLPDYTEVMKTITHNKMLIWGKHDSFLTINKMKDKVIDYLNLEEKNVHLLEAKHFIQEEKPEEISALILEFIA